MMPPLAKVADDIWVADIPHSFIGLQLGTRMTVVRLSSGLLLHSPIPMTAALQANIDALGVVKHIVCPNVFHHVYAGEAVRAYPDALLHGPAKLAKKRRDLHFDVVLSEIPHPDWNDELMPITIAGSIVGETVLFHPASRTLVTSDLVENFRDHSHTPTRVYLRLGGLLGKPGWHPMMRLVYVNRKAARASVERILALPFERVTLAHGDIITGNARETVRQGLSWLLG
jgi:hypothetical protein